MLTGGTGFIGSHLTEELLKRGYDVSLLLRHSPRKFDVPLGATSYTGDLLDIYSLKKIIKHLQPEAILHLAGMTPVRHSFANPVIYAETNLLGTMNLSLASKECSSLEKFIVASTAEVYKSKDSPIKETDELYGTTPYGVSKVAVDYWIRVAGDCYGLPYILLRPSNTYFRKTERGYFIEKVITTMLTSNKLVLNGTPDSERDWMFVDDHVQGYIKALESDSVNDVYNISTGVGTSVGDVVEMVKEMIGWKGTITWGGKPRPNEPKYLILDNSKARRELNFIPKYPLERGLQIVINHWKRVLDV